MEIAKLDNPWRLLQLVQAAPYHLLRLSDPDFGTHWTPFVIALATTGHLST